VGAVAVTIGVPAVASIVAKPDSATTKFVISSKDTGVNNIRAGSSTIAAITDVGGRAPGFGQ